MHLQICRTFSPFLLVHTGRGGVCIQAREAQKCGSRTGAASHFTILVIRRNVTNKTSISTTTPALFRVRLQSSPSSSFSPFVAALRHRELVRPALVADVPPEDVLVEVLLVLVLPIVSLLEVVRVLDLQKKICDGPTSINTTRATPTAAPLVVISDGVEIRVALRILFFFSLF